MSDPFSRTPRAPAEPAQARYERYLSGGPINEALGSILKRYLKRSGLASRIRHRKLYSIWQQALGDKAGRTRIVGVRRGELEVEVASAALRQELELQRHMYVKVLQAEVERPFVERIRFGLGNFER